MIFIIRYFFLGASFAEALGMISPSKSSISSKKKSSSSFKMMSESSESPNETTYKQNPKEDVTIIFSDNFNWTFIEF